MLDIRNIQKFSYIFKLPDGLLAVEHMQEFIQEDQNLERKSSTNSVMLTVYLCGIGKTFLKSITTKTARTPHLFLSLQSPKTSSFLVLLSTRSLMVDGVVEMGEVRWKDSHITGVFTGWWIKWGRVWQDMIQTRKIWEGYSWPKDQVPLILNLSFQFSFSIRFFHDVLSTFALILCWLRKPPTFLCFKKIVKCNALKFAEFFSEYFGTQSLA